MFEDTNNGHTCYCENCLELQEENKKLISTNNFLSMYIVEANNIKDKNKKLEQKFEKIKEVITQRNTDCLVCGDYKEGYCNGVGECERRDYKSILTIIEEQE